MTKLKNHFLYQDDGLLDLSHWLKRIENEFPDYEQTLLKHACLLAQQLTQGLTTFYGQPRLEFGLEVVEVIFSLKLFDPETAVASLIGSTIQLTPTLKEKIRKELGENIVRLVQSFQQMEIVPSIQSQQQVRNKSEPEKIRRMLLAMAADIRVVIIKLAERLCFMRGIKGIPQAERRRFAQEILDIYAPLANRLGIGQLKWELEDFAFHYTNPQEYKTIAAFLAERRIDRETRIKQLMIDLQQKLLKVGVKAQVMGRAKHIYSIYLKKQRKHLDYQEIYDSSAMRILVDSVEDCYAALSLVHSLWKPLMDEFDDYIAHPKANGYRSIHTAVMGDDDKHCEIQIRTHAMHEEAERGIAAHWLYKENSAQNFDQKAKISYVHQLLDWHQEMARSSLPDASFTHFQKEIYIITPAGDILNLPEGATPIDFAYHIHSALGHRCRGAKVNGQIVPLTHTLKTGDKVEIMTTLQGAPSRDWLNTELGYVKTLRARNKISHWFKQQAYQQDLITGREIVEKELARNGLTKNISLNAVAKKFQLKDEEALLISIARGNVRVMQIINALQPNKPLETAAPTSISLPAIPQMNYGSAIAGGSDLLSRLAKCCKPIPGDEIIGYITQGRGISIHKKSCRNIQPILGSNRLMAIEWDKKNSNVFSADLKIVAMDEKNILQDITGFFSNEKIILLRFHFTYHKNQNKIIILATVQIQTPSELTQLLRRLQQLPHVLEVSRE